MDGRLSHDPEITVIIAVSVVTGVDVVTVTIEVNMSCGIRFFLVGLPDSAVKESHQRTESALRVLNHYWPAKQVMINMAAADIRKEESAYGLPLALTFLPQTKKLRKGRLSHLF
jgi:magnesium chelatase family protein